LISELATALISELPTLIPQVATHLLLRGEIAGTQNARARGSQKATGAESSLESRSLRGGFFGELRDDGTDAQGARGAAEETDEMANHG